MNKHNSKQWFPLWVDNWLFGSTRIELQPDERGVWVDLMALANKDGGFIRANVDVAYPINQLAGLLNISEELLKRTVSKCVATGKVNLYDNDTMYLTNFDKYALSDRRKRDLIPESGESSTKAEPVSEKAVPIIEYSITEKNKIEDIREEEQHPFFRSNTFQKTFERFEIHRKELKATLTPYARKRAIGTLDKLSGGDILLAIAILEQSIDNCWRGLFPLKTKQEVKEPVRQCNSCSNWFGESILKKHLPECSKKYTNKTTSAVVQGMVDELANKFTLKKVNGKGQ
jgi:hypothetical protein